MATPVRSDPDVAEVRKALATLRYAAGRLRARHAETVGLRRLASDVDRIAEDLDLLGDLPPLAPRGDALPRLEFVQDTPYDPTVFAGADDEGLSGMRDSPKPR
jgi:hypothetical protein